MTLPERLKKVRHHVGKSQKDISSGLGISTRTWQIYEEGGSVPGGNVLEGLARIGIDLNWLLTGKGEMTRAEGGGSATGFDQKRLIKAIEIAETALSETESMMGPQEKGELVGVVYDLLREGGNKEEFIGFVVKLIKASFRACDSEVGKYEGKMVS